MDFGLFRPIEDGDKYTASPLGLPDLSGNRKLQLVPAFNTYTGIGEAIGAYLSELDQRLRQLGGQSGPPRYYQALLKVRVENSFPTKVSLLTVRELQVGTQ
ncbi:MAG: hypothetical protein ACREAB_07540 [Blastocatellia bacterium]